MFTPEINKAATEAFQNIIRIKGREVLKNSKSVQNLISDFLPGYEYEPARNLIRIACEWNIFALLLDESIPEANRADYAAKKMTEKTFVPVETSKEVISWVAEALKIKQKNPTVATVSGEKKPQSSTIGQATTQAMPTNSQKQTGVHYSHGLAFSKLQNGTYAVIGVGTCNDTHLIIPPTTPAGGTVSTIGEEAFAACADLVSVTIPNTVTTIGEKAFQGCKGLSSITFSSSLVTIEDSAFQLCSNLKSVSLPYGVRSIGKGAFSLCNGLTSVSIPSSMTNIGNQAFQYCSGLTSVTIPNSVATIGDAAFWECEGLVSVKLSENITAIGAATFYKCKSLVSVTIPSRVTTIGVNAFLECEGLTALTIPNNVTTVGNCAFKNCRGLHSVSISNTVTTIGDCAFEGCSGLSSVTIPSSVMNMGFHAFSNCGRLIIRCEHTKKPSNWDDNWNLGSWVTWQRDASATGSRSGHSTSQTAKPQLKKKKPQKGLVITSVLLCVVLAVVLFATVDWRIMKWVASPLSAAVLLAGIALLSLILTLNKDFKISVNAAVLMLLAFTVANTVLTTLFEDMYRPFGIFISIFFALFLMTIGLFVSSATAGAFSSVLGAVNGLTAYLTIMNKTDAFIWSTMRIAVPLLVAAVLCFMLAPYKKENMGKRFVIFVIGVVGCIVSSILAS